MESCRDIYIQFSSPLSVSICASMAALIVLTKYLSSSSFDPSILYIKYLIFLSRARFMKMFPWSARFFALTLLIVILIALENVLAGSFEFKISVVVKTWLYDESWTLRVRMRYGKAGVLKGFKYCLTDWPSLLRQLCTWVLSRTILVTLSTAMSLDYKNNSKAPMLENENRFDEEVNGAQ